MTSQAYKINTAFAVPIAEARYPNPEKLNQELKALFVERAEEGDKYKNPYMTPGKEGLFESDFNVFAWPEPCVQELRKFCLQNLARTVAELSGFTQERLDRLNIFTHTWYHVTYKGGYTRAHNHPMAAWSGVYCVDPGEDAPDMPDSGILRFEDTRHFAQMYLDPANIHMQSPYGFGSLNFKLEAGQLVLFPSWLVHEVAPFFGDDVRITLAFNAWFKSTEEAST
ncbi:MAG: 2OG-Fe(II) oxygenase family protein [Gammaproteobacteria bacterium]|nr:2OG-Fe(II) oxygenase family protein [Gammaproteobacteria bacterium]